MNATLQSFLIFQFALLGTGCRDHSTNNDAQLLNTHVSIDFSLGRGEDPAPFVKALTPKLDRLGFQFRRSELPAGMGVVWVMVQDDNLTETYRIFEQALAETGNPYRTQIFVKVITPGVSSMEEHPAPSNPR